MADTQSIAFEDRGLAAGRGGLMEFWKPLSWSAIVGGTVMALGIQLVLTLFGVGIGMAMVNPVTDPDPTNGISTGAIAWLIVSGIISFGVGGWVAGHMSGVLRTGSGVLHGFSAWALAAVLGVALTTMAGSPILGGAAAGVGAANGTSGSYSNPAGVTTSTLADGTVRFSDAYGKTMTEAEVRAAADETRRAVAQVSLWTGLAFLLSMVASGIGGRLGRSSPRDVLRGEAPRHTRRDLQPNPA